MRILMVSDFYPPFIGGAERQVQLLSRELTARGHTLQVATLWQPALPAQDAADGIDVRRLRGLTTTVPWFSKDPGRRFHPPFPDVALRQRLRRLADDFHPDLVHATGWSAYSAASVFGGKSGTPLLVSARDYGYSCAIRTLLHDHQVCTGPGFAKCVRCARRVYGFSKAAVAAMGVSYGAALLVRRVTAFHAISTFVRDILTRDLLLPAGRSVPIHIIPSFREDRHEQPPSSNLQERLPPGPYILYVGALQAHKGVEVLLAAYARLSAPPPLVLIGTRWANSPTMMPPGVVVLEDVPHNDVMAAWEGCLFGVAPSLWAEPFGGVIHEAMSKGKAVIATNVGGPLDMIRPGETGLLIPPGDVSALAQAMQDLLDQPEWRARLGQAGQVRSRMFTAGAVLPDFEQLYQQVVATA